MAHEKISPRTLALYVTPRGIGFVCFVHPSMVIDWGTRYAPTEGRNPKTLRIAKELIDQFSPNVLVIENVDDGYSKRGARAKSLCRAFAKYGAANDITVNAYSRRDVKDVFSVVGASNKHDLNAAVAQLLPALIARQPRKRQEFHPERSSQGMFDAAAIGLTFFVRTKRFDVAKAMQEEIGVIEA